MKTIGLLLVFFGIACGDSPSLLIPAVLLGLGAVLYRAGEKKSPQTERNADS